MYFSKFKSFTILIYLTYYSIGFTLTANIYTRNDLFLWLRKSNLGYSVFQNALQYSNDTLCLKRVRELVQAADAQEIWALKFLDAWGKFPAGLLYGDFVDLGNYDLCQSLAAGKYCLANMPFETLTAMSEYKPTLVLRIAACMPAECSAQMLDFWLKDYMSLMFENTLLLNGSLVQEAGCKAEIANESLNALDWFALGALILLAVLLLSSTLADYYVERHMKKLHPLLLAFSLRVNLRQLLHVSNSKQTTHVINCLHGIRCMSIIWIIFGHGYMLLLLSPIINALDIVEWAQTPYSMFLQSGTVSVDTFFFLSGLLLVMVTLRSMDKDKGHLNVLLMYVHRYIRLTPVLALAVLLFASLYRHTGNGPLWSEFTSAYRLCDDTWWATLLYVQNYAAAGKMCLGHSWYLAVDMQLYILSPILLIPLWRWGKKAAAAIAVLTLFMLACLFLIIVFNDLVVFSQHGNLGEDTPEMRKIYYTTHARAVPWLIGLLFGHYLHCGSGKRNIIPKVYICLGWLVASGVFLGVLFAVYPKTQKGAVPITPLLGAIYLSLSRIGWPLALCWIVFSCINGYARPVNAFLSWSFWHPISKLSYCLYIWHLLVELANIGRLKTNTYFSNYDASLMFWSNFGITLLIATVMHLSIEAPMIGVEKFLFSSKRQRKTSSVQATTTPAINSLNTANISQQNLVCMMYNAVLVIAHYFCLWQVGSLIKINDSMLLTYNAVQHYEFSVARVVDGIVWTYL